MELNWENNSSSPSYYTILGVSVDSTDDQIRRAYHKLAMQWHPDKWTRNPCLLGEAKRKFQQIQEAYSVLSDKNKRIMYDAGMYDPSDEEDEGFSDFLQEMTSLMQKARQEEKKYSLGDLQCMFWEMAQSFDGFPEMSSSYCQVPSEYSQWCYWPHDPNNVRSDTNSGTGTGLSFGSSFAEYGAGQFCM